MNVMDFTLDTMNTLLDRGAKFSRMHSSEVLGELQFSIGEKDYTIKITEVGPSDETTTTHR
tara:strand:- start:122 stop:304 length:183 start_codon:yes stop_codon:yes gene_type:complete